MRDFRDHSFQTVFLSDKIGYGVATINVLYRMPDEALLRSFIWQFHDIAPSYPRLARFLNFWLAEVDGIIHCVEVAHSRQASGSELRHASLHRYLN